jgi:Flp pilus assembly protein TadB
MTVQWWWLLLGVGLSLLPPVRETVCEGQANSGAGRLSGRPRESVSPRTLQMVAAVATGLSMLAVAGPAAGALFGAIAGAAAWLLIGVLSGRTPRRRASADLALALDLVATALRSGQPLSSALLLAAPSADPDSAAVIARTGGLLRLGADPADAWALAAEHVELEAVAVAATRSAASGIRLAAAFDRLAADVRANAATAAEARAHRAGVLVVAPLGLCFLPAFVCLGIAPVIVGIAGRVLTSLQ